MEAAAVKALELEAENKALKAKNNKLSDDATKYASFADALGEDPFAAFNKLKKDLAEARRKQVVEEQTMTDEQWQKALNEERTKRLKAEADCKAQKAALEARVKELETKNSDLENCVSQPAAARNESLNKQLTDIKKEVDDLLKENAKLKAKEIVCDQLKKLTGAREPDQLKKLLEQVGLEDRMNEAMQKADKLEAEAKGNKARITALQNQVATATENQEAAIRDKKAAELNVEIANMRADAFRADIKALEGGDSTTKQRVVDLTSDLAKAKGEVVIAQAQVVAWQRAKEESEMSCARLRDQLDQSEQKALALETANKELQRNITKCTFELAREQAAQAGHQQGHQQRQSQPEQPMNVNLNTPSAELTWQVTAALPSPALVKAIDALATCQKEKRQPVATAAYAQAFRKYLAVNPQTGVAPAGDWSQYAPEDSVAKRKKQYGSVAQNVELLAQSHRTLAQVLGIAERVGTLLSTNEYDSGAHSQILATVNEFEESVRDKLVTLFSTIFQQSSAPASSRTNVDQSADFGLLLTYVNQVVQYAKASGNLPTPPAAYSRDKSDLEDLADILRVFDALQTDAVRATLDAIECKVK